MKLRITANKTLNQIQNEFQKEFPFLKIEFFSQPHRAEEASAKKDLLDATLNIGNISKAQGEFTITSKTRVNELEQQFRRDFGLNVQVFRKAGNIWLETSTTDALTLEQQQTEAKEGEKQYLHSMHNFADERD